MVNAIVRWILSFILKIFDYILGIVLSVFSPIMSDNFNNLILSSGVYLERFYGYIMKYFLLVRNIFDINSFEMGLIVELLTVTLLYKPLSLAIKLFIKWFNNLKI